MSSLLNTLLADRSGLTLAQINTMILQKRVQNGELNVREAASKRSPEPVSVGAYHRVLSQAKASVEESVYTLLLCEKLGFVGINDLKKLFDLVGKVPADMDEVQAGQVMSLVDSLVRKIVTL